MMQISVANITREADSLVRWTIYVNTVFAGTISITALEAASVEEQFIAQDSGAAQIDATRTRAGAANAIIENFIINPPGS